MQEDRAVPRVDCELNNQHVSPIDCLPSLDVALAEPHDKALFYSASVHFLRKRLQQKSAPLIHIKCETSYSCTDIRSGTEKQPRTSILKPEKVTEIKPPELSMQQLLPFPKANRDGFLLRIMNSFRRHRKYTVDDLTEPDEDDTGNFISRFKFPRCERLDKDLKCLVKFSDEKSEITDSQEAATMNIKATCNMEKGEHSSLDTEDEHEIRDEKT